MGAAENPVYGEPSTFNLNQFLNFLFAVGTYRGDLSSFDINHCFSFLMLNHVVTKIAIQ